MFMCRASRCESVRSPYGLVLPVACKSRRHECEALCEHTRYQVHYSKNRVNTCFQWNTYSQRQREKLGHSGRFGQFSLIEMWKVFRGMVSAGFNRRSSFFVVLQGTRWCCFEGLEVCGRNIIIRGRVVSSSRLLARVVVAAETRGRKP